jgi:predicted DNA-binding transcriptional regulator YafY
MSAEKTLRWLHLFDLLAAHPGGLTVGQLHSRLGQDDAVRHCTRRTVERDLEEMSLSGVIGLYNPDPDALPATWALQANALGGRTLSPHGAATLKMVLRYLDGVLPPTMLASLRQQEAQADKVLALRDASDPGKRPWTSKVRMLPDGHRLLPPHIPTQLLATAHEALASERQVRASYRKPGAGEESVRDYSVLGLVIRPPKYQLVVRTDRDPHLLNLHRIGTIVLLDSATAWPEGFDLDAWLATGAADTRLGDRIETVIDTTSPLAEYWRETPLGANQRIEAGEHGARVTVPLLQTESMRRYLLGLGDQMTVVAPASLRDWLRDEAARLAARYA